MSDVDSYNRFSGRKFFSAHLFMSLIVLLLLTANAKANANATLTATLLNCDTTTPVCSTYIRTCDKCLQLFGLLLQYCPVLPSILTIRSRDDQIFVS